MWSSAYKESDAAENTDVVFVSVSLYWKTGWYRQKMRTFNKQIWPII